MANPPIFALPFRRPALTRVTRANPLYMPKLRNTPAGNKQMLDIRMHEGPQEAGPHPMVPSVPVPHDKNFEPTKSTYSTDQRYRPRAGHADRLASNVYQREHEIE